MSKRIMITGAVASAGPGFGGHSWAVLQYIVGFRRLGFETYYAEELDKRACVDDEGCPAEFAESANVRYFRSLMDRFDLQDHVALLERKGAGHAGLSVRQLEQLASDIDLVINRSGRFQVASVMERVRRRMYLDVDPGYTQIWQDRYGVDMNLRGHDLYVTVGLNVGAPDYLLPTAGVQWHTTLPPVVLASWKTPSAPGAAYTSVADWRAAQWVEWNGVRYGPKSEQFLRLIDLPRRVPVPLEICLLIHPDEKDRFELERCGWRLASPCRHTATPDAYREYLSGSRAEFSVAKEVYARGKTGWFSDRTACYLAASRPVIVQDTGIGNYLPTGAGLVTFTDIDSAVEAIHRVENQYERHAAAAMDLAVRHLDSNLVLSRLAQLAGL